MAKDQEPKKGWLSAKLEDWEFRRLYNRELVAESFVTKIETAMADKDVSKTELARRMECSTANISRAMRKTTNMTIATMVDMALSLDLCVDIEVRPVAAEDRCFSPVASSIEGVAGSG